jgi:hypothetical protein
VIHQIPELRRIRLQSKFSRQGCDSAKACCAYCNKQQGRNDEDTQDLTFAIQEDAPPLKGPPDLTARIIVYCSSNLV